MTSAGKVVKLRRLEEMPALLSGKKAVLAGGCFDILHVGHIRYLEGARRLGETLVVAIYNDESARRLKGPGRPILNESERVALVSALRCVDHVVVFDEHDFDSVLNAVRPAVRAEVQDTGGQSHSTNDVIRRILETHERN